MANQTFTFTNNTAGANVNVAGVTVVGPDATTFN